MEKIHVPDEPFPNLKPQNPWIQEFYVVQERCVTNLKAPKMCRLARNGGGPSRYLSDSERTGRVPLFLGSQFVFVAA